MFIKKFSVQNYKNFKKKYTLDFSDVKDYPYGKQCISNGMIKNAIIYGKNAAGKTNFGLAMLDITCHLVDKNAIPESFVNYSNADSSDPVVSFSYVFVNDSDEYRYDYKKTGAQRLVSEELYCNGRVVFTFDYMKQQGDFSHLEEYHLNTLNWKFRKTGASLLRYMANNSSLDDDNPVSAIMGYVSGMLWFRSLGKGNDYMGFMLTIEDMIDYIIRNDYVEDFQAFLKEYGVDEAITVKQSADGSYVLYFKHKNLIPFISAASNGTQALLTFYYWYKHLKDITFLFIDEFDAFYHYELAEKIVKLLEEKYSIQVVLTSHNTGLLSNRIMRPDCYFLLLKDHLTSLANATDRELRMGYNLEKLLRNGEFDG